MCLLAVSFKSQTHFSLISVEKQKKCLEGVSKISGEV